MQAALDLIKKIKATFALFPPRLEITFLLDIPGEPGDVCADWWFLVCGFFFFFPEIVKNKLHLHFSGHK